MKIVLAFVASLAVAIGDAFLFQRLEPFLARAPEPVTVVISGLLFFGGIALVWAPWFYITRR